MRSTEIDREPHGGPSALVPLDEDPLRAATGLLALRRWPTQLGYERGREFRLALGTRAEVTANHSVARVRTQDGEKTLTVQGNPLMAVAELLDAMPIAGWTALGWADFELAYAVAGLPPVSDAPLIRVVVPEVEVRLTGRRATVLAADEQGLDMALDALLHRGPNHAPDHPPVTADIPVHTPDPSYTDAVSACVAAIRAGRLEKVILSRTVEVEGPVDLYASYAHGRRNNTPARSFLIDTPELRAVGFSPETVLELDAAGTVRTQPLAGTRARTGDPATDQRLRTELTTDPKEIFEHAISVRLAAEELGRICAQGTVAVRDFMTVKERGRVQHLGSELVGQLPPVAAGDSVAGRSWRAFGTLFPAVTASGIPKAAAYEAIRHYEREPRGLYAGAVFSTDHTGAIDAALVLRTAFSTGEKTWLRAGAGIVAQSRPEREFTETCEKLSSVAGYLVRG
jgi:salicylate synthase